MALTPMMKQQMLARELRIIRGQRRADQIAAALGWSTAKVSRYELARTRLDPVHVAALLDYYRITGDKRQHLMDLAAGADMKAWWDDYLEDLTMDDLRLIGFQEGASHISVWQPDMVPVLLRTEGYAKAAIQSRGQVELIPPGLARRRLEATMRRQIIMTRDAAPELAVILAQSALSRTVGSKEVMKRQLDALISWSTRPGITIRVIPTGVPHPAYGGPFTVLQFMADGEPVFPDVTGLEHMHTTHIEDDEATVYLYSVAFRFLETVALDPERSREVISRMATSH